MPIAFVKEMQTNLNCGLQKWIPIPTEYILMKNITIA